jgi:outer membrane protein assembly factor BamB
MMSGGILIAAAARQAPGQTPDAPAKIFERTWNHTLGAPADSRQFIGMAAGPSRVFITDGETGIHARAIEDGAEVWRAELPSNLPAAVAGDQVYVASAGQLQALDEATGRVRWTRPLPAAAVGLIAHASGALIATGRSVHAWAADGTSRWEQMLTADVGRELLAIDGTQVYVGVTDLTLVALDLSSGAPRWTRRIGTLPLAFTAAGGKLFFGGTDRRLHAYDRDGGLDWRYQRENVVGAPAVDDEHVYAALWDNTIVAHDRGNGHLQWRRSLDNRPARGPMLSGPQLVAILRSDAVVTMPRTADTTSPGPAAPPAAAPPDSSRNRVLVAVPALDGTRIFAVIQLENTIRIAVAYTRS